MTALTATGSAAVRPATVRLSRGRRAFRADIQGLRAVAILLVLLYHARVTVVSGGYIGVDVFFVISGFLIISHLVATLYRGERIRFAEFYANRARRILPAALVVILLTMAAAAVFVSPLTLRRVMGDALATALYVPNVLFALRDTNYLADQTPSLFQHYWSLGIEEQFYLVVPALLAVAFWATRRSRTGLFVVVVVLVAVSFTAGVLLTNQSQSQAFFLLPTRAWELGVGGIIAFLVQGGKLAIKPVIGAILSWLGLAMIVAAAFTFNDATQFPGFAAAVPVLGSALVILGGHSRSPAGALGLLRLWPFQWLGLISYSLYLVHWPLLTITRRAVDSYSQLPDWVYWLLGLAAIPLAWVLYLTVENPVRRMPALLKRRAWVTLTAALVTTLAVSGASLAASNASNTVQLYVSTPVPTVAITAVPATPSATPIAAPPMVDFVPQNLTPSLATAVRDNPILYRNGCHITEPQTAVQDCRFGDTTASRFIALFGDSHAAQWFPALNAWASRNGYALQTYTKSACPSVAISTIWPRDVYTACTTWRQAVLDRLIANPPAAVVISNSPYVTPADSSTPLATQWAKGLAATVAALSPHTLVAVVKDTPYFADSPVDCLSRNLTKVSNCTPPVASVIDIPLSAAEQTAVTSSGGAWLDMSPYLCTTSVCLVITGNYLMYRDSEHMTNTFSDALGTVFGATLRSVLPALKK